jgi:transcription elongation factor Elf1
MSKTSKSERLEIYKNRDVQVLLSKFLNEEIKELLPISSPDADYGYPIVEAIVGDGPHAKAFLDRLYQAGILERRVYDEIISCPKCGSTRISVRYFCPHCKSFDIQKSSLIEHVKCGYIDVEDNFHKENKLVCPRCHEELKKPDVDYRKAGVWCTCKDCHKSFDIPVASHFCKDCHGDFTFEEVTIKNVYSYNLREEARNEATLGSILITPIKDLLGKEGFKVESPAFLKGKSGTNHYFDIVVRKGADFERVAVIDLASSSEGTISEQPVIALFAKIFDVSPDDAYLVALPKMSENAKKMAQLYKIHVIEAKNEKEATKALREELSSKD